MVQGEYQDVIKYFAEMFNFQIRQFNRLDGKWGTLNKGTGLWNGMISNLINGEVDLLLASLNFCCERTTVLDYFWTLSYSTTGEINFIP